jgi:hypothetical protein
MRSTPETGGRAWASGIAIAVLPRRRHRLRVVSVTFLSSIKLMMAPQDWEMREQGCVTLKDLHLSMPSVYWPSISQLTFL